MLKFTQEEIEKLTPAECAKFLPDIMASLKSFPKPTPQVFSTIRPDGHYSLDEMKKMPVEFVSANINEIKKSVRNPRASGTV